MNAPAWVDITQDEALRLAAAIAAWRDTCPCTCDACKNLNRTIQEVWIKEKA